MDWTGVFLKIHSKSEVGSEIARIYVRYDNVERLQTCRSGNSIGNVPPPAFLLVAAVPCHNNHASRMMIYIIQERHCKDIYKSIN